MLLVTQAVGWLHILFEYLAFRDDLQFFQVRKGKEDVAFLVVLTDCFHAIL